MNIQRVSFSPIHEDHQHWEASSQEAQMEGGVSEPISPSFEAKRIEARVKSMPNASPERQQPRPVVNNVARKVKNVLHSAAIVCGVGVFPSFACLILGPIGLIAPFGLLTACLILFCLAGKKTPEQEVALHAVREAARSYDPR